MAPSVINDAPVASGRNSPKPPPARIWNVSEPPFEGYKPVDNEGYARSNHDTAIIIDNGTTASYRHALVANTDGLQGRQQYAQDGLSTQNRVSQCYPIWRAIGTASSTAHSLS